MYDGSSKDIAALIICFSAPTLLAVVLKSMEIVDVGRFDILAGLVLYGIYLFAVRSRL
jgi:hypothetical protein